MDKKSVSASLLIVYLASLFALVGSCFYAFVFKDKQIKVESVNILTVEGVSVFNDKDKKEQSTSLNLSNMELGIRPATGEINQETQVPSTINDTNTSEGYYAKVFVDSNKNYKIIIKDIKVKTQKNEIDAKEQLKNVFISLKDIKNTTKALEEDEFELVNFQDVSETQELVFLIWLGALADDVLQGAKISFSLSFEEI